MIDDSDGDYVLFFSGGSLMLVVIAIILYVIAALNDEECSRRHCPTGQRARLLDHECVCTSEPEP